ncbi:MAG TPA: tyrosine-type recombinase/integrase [Terriglobales bacterium]|jgi:integrase|nr:tyrosine-type recombinase/integrase [Terriglobales bacterium]
MSNQKGYVFRAGEFWWLRFFESRVQDGKVVRKQRAKKLCRILPEHKRLKRPPEYVERMQEEFVAQLNRHDATPERHIPLRTFFTEVFLPHMAQRRKRSTCYCQLTNWDKHLAPRIGDIHVADFTTVDAQRTLDWIGRDNPKLARQTLFRLKSLMSAVFRHAVNQGFCNAPNPVSLAEIGAGQPSKIMPHYLLAEVRNLLAVLPEPSRTAVAIASFTGLRRGEIEGLRWEHVLPDAIRVECSVWNGKVYETKTLASKGLVPLIPALKIILEAHRLRSGNPSTGPIFPTRNGTPVSMNNLLNDAILPTLRRCVHCGKPESKPHVGHKYERDDSRPDWKAWHAFRRGLATNLFSLGVEDLTIQKILRHSSLETTRRAYIRSLPEQSVDAMSRLEGKLSSMIQ